MPSCSKESMKRAVFEYFPVCEWVPKYELKDLTADLMAGFTVGIVSVPIAMALAALANIPEVIGLYTTCIPPFFFAFFSTSRHVSIGMFAVIALLVRSAEIRHLSENATIEFNQDMDIADLPSVQLLTTLTFTTGLVMFVMSIFRLHIIASYMSHSLIGGFTTAAAIHIMLSQVPPVLQLDLAKRSGLFKAIFVGSQN
uniref:SLC26A/SulP transporter domain-containing protein n=1 Tax=Acrobeloides nanus TaxID=290746 RepID=A0A914ESE6_9BILA